MWLCRGLKVGVGWGQSLQGLPGVWNHPPTVPLALIVSVISQSIGSCPFLCLLTCWLNFRQHLPLQPWAALWAPALWIWASILHIWVNHWTEDHPEDR